MKRKGRPKLSQKTNVIGISKSKNKVGCQKFSEMKNSEKEKFILSLCIGNEISDKVLFSGGRVEEGDVNPTEIDSAVFHSNILSPQFSIYSQWTHGLVFIRIIMIKCNSYSFNVTSAKKQIHYLMI